MISLVHGKFYEDLEVGDKFLTLSRTVTEADIVGFIAMAGIYEELFMNVEYAATKTLFGKKIAPAALTYSYAEGLVVQSGLLHDTGMAFLGMELKVPRPVAQGDTIHVEIEIIEKNPTKDSDRGVVVTRNQVVNQRGEVALEYTPARLVRRRQG